MNKLTVEDLLNLVKSYNPDEMEIIKRVYYYADNLHSGQKRQSGEPYYSSSQCCLYSRRNAR